MVKKLFFIFLSTLFLQPIGHSAEPTTIEAIDFINNSKQMPISERLDFIKQTLQSTTNESILSEAIWDLAMISREPQQAKDALEIVENILLSSKQDTKINQRATLAKARILARLGEKEESLTIFRHAICEKWRHDLVGEILEALEETGDFDLMARCEYDFRAGNNYPEDLLQYYGRQENIIDMLSHLQGMKAMEAESSAIEKVYIYLPDSPTRPYLKQIGYALCLAADERYSEALLCLTDVETKIQSESDSVYDEAQDIPLYRCAILLYEGKDYNLMRRCFKEYMAINESDEITKLRAAIKLTYGFEHDIYDLSKIAELTSLLLIDGYDKKRGADDEKYWKAMASLHAMHLISLDKRKQWLYAREFCKEAKDNFYPGTLGGATAALYHGAYLMRDGDYNGAEKIFLDLIEKFPHDLITPYAKSYLAHLWYQLEIYPDESLELIQDVKQRVIAATNNPILSAKQQVLLDEKTRVENLEFKIFHRLGKKTNDMTFILKESYPQWGFEWR